MPDDLPSWVQQYRWDVGARIRALRTARRLTQEELAAAIGIDSKTISRAENGVYAVSVDQLARIARGLGVGPAELLPDVEPEP